MATEKKTDRKTAAKTVAKSVAKTPSAPRSVQVSHAQKATNGSALTHEEIARRAYEKFVLRGRLNGFAAEDWFAAEAELSAGRRSARS